MSLDSRDRAALASYASYGPPDEATYDEEAIAKWNVEMDAAEDATIAALDAVFAAYEAVTGDYDDDNRKRVDALKAAIEAYQRADDERQGVALDMPEGAERD